MITSAGNLYQVTFTSNTMKFEVLEESYNAPDFYAEFYTTPMLTYNPANDELVGHFLLKEKSERELQHVMRVWNVGEKEFVAEQWLGVHSNENDMTQFLRAVFFTKESQLGMVANEYDILDPTTLKILQINSNTKMRVRDFNTKSAVNKI